MTTSNAHPDNSRNSSKVHESLRAASGWCCVLTDHPTIAQLHDAVPVGRIFFGVRDLNDGRSLFIQFLEKLHDLFALRGMEIARRLVGEEKLGSLNYRPRHADQLLLSTGELIRKQIFLADNVEAIQSVADQA